MRTAVRQQISPNRHQRLHRRAAAALAQLQAEPATVAYQWEQAGDRPQESKYLLLAARKADRQYAIDDALRFYRRVVPHLEDEAEKLEAMRQAGRLYQRISDWERSQQVLQAGLAASMRPKTLFCSRICSVVYGMR